MVLCAIFACNTVQYSNVLKSLQIIAACCVQKIEHETTSRPITVQ